MLRPILWATLVAGTLDIGFALIAAQILAGDMSGVLPTVASGPFGDTIADGPLGAPLGLLVHFAIMAVMVTVYVLLTLGVPALNRYWIAAGLLYGIVLWLAMYWVVMPLRWEGYHTPSGVAAIARQLFAHCVLVGLPIAWFAARHARSRPSPA
jgi:hypothetical protein